VRLKFFTAPASHARQEAALAALARLGSADRTFIVGASRPAADELAFLAARRSGGVFGVTRIGYAELTTKLALPALAHRGVSPTSGLGLEAIAARATFRAQSDGHLTYFSPVASLPGFSRALGRTVADLRMAQTQTDQLTSLQEVGPDLAELLRAVEEEATSAATADRAALLDTAAQALRSGCAPVPLDGAAVVLLDVPVTTRADAEFLRALAQVTGDIFATVPEGDTLTVRALQDAGFTPSAATHKPHRTALGRLQARLFTAGEDLEVDSQHESADASVTMFSAPGEGRECVEIARRILAEGRRGVCYDEMAVLLRAPATYLGLLEHALHRAGIPAWFDRGTRRPDPAGRAFLAMLACADEDLSARRFAEYLSLGQVPAGSQTDEEHWSPPADDVTSSIVPAVDRPADREPHLEAEAAAREPMRDGIHAGSLRAPWRWEELLVESAVIGQHERWERRLRGLAEEYRRKIDELQSDEPESPRIPALRRDREQLDHLQAFALPLVREMAAWPRGAVWCWGEWLAVLRALAPRILRQPSRVLRVLQELGPLADVGPVSLAEVRDVLSPRLLTLTHEPPRRRHGRVFVGVPSAARGRTFRVVFVPGLAERVFPQRLREDPLLLDERRQRLGGDLITQKQRADAERLQLRLAVGAASERVYVSWPRVELQESRQRVPSFYVLDIARAVEGRIPPYAQIRDRAYAEGAATLAWPAPARPADAIDEFEHDLAMLHQLLAGDREAARGRARYLYELSAHLQRSLTARWARWQKRWHSSDGLIRATPRTAPALAAQRLGQRPFSLSALQRYAECPYQFQLAAMYQLAPLEEPAPLQRLDPLTRGSLFHEIQAEFFRTLEANGLLPISGSRAASAKHLLDWAITKVGDHAREKLAPAIDRVWRDELASIARDLRAWFDLLVHEDRDWRPERFEFAFGLPGDLQRDPRSVPHPAHVDGRFLIRGSIDLVERRIDGSTLRVTDHKTGKNRTTRATVVHGGRVLQPILYGMALEALTGERVESGRLSFCTATGGYTSHTIALDETNRRRGLEVLEIIDRAIEHGTLAARPAEGACSRCDFTPVCGSEEERRTRYKPAGLFADLDALRRMP
jgi:ATP-dependent helicase/nuclease subunit B